MKNVFKNIDKYVGKKVRVCTEQSPVKPTTIHIHKIMDDPLHSGIKDYDLIIYRILCKTYWKWYVVNRTVLYLYNSLYEQEKKS